MTKIALITDNHFGCRNDSPVFHDYTRKSFQFFFDELEKRNIGTCIHLGDLFDRRKYLNYVTAKLARESFLQPLEDLGIQTHIICGNHDVYWKNTNEVNSLDELVGNRYSYIKTYSEPTKINVDGLDILLLPWINQSNAHASHFEIKTTRAEIVMGHLELNGFEMFRGVVSDHGGDKGEFSRFDMVMSGHYHHKSSFENIHYLGAFLEQTWSDYNDPRGFHIFDTATRELEFIQNPYTIFKMISYDDVKHPDIIEKIMATDYSKYKDCYVKIVCVNRTNAYAFDTLFDKLYKESPTDISVIEDISAFKEGEASEEVDQTQDTPTILSSYIKGLTLPVDNAKMIDYMKDIYQEAISQEYVE